MFNRPPEKLFLGKSVKAFDVVEHYIKSFFYFLIRVVNCSFICFSGTSSIGITKFGFKSEGKSIIMHHNCHSSVVHLSFWFLVELKNNDGHFLNFERPLGRIGGMQEFSCLES